MRIVPATQLIDPIRRLCLQACCDLPADVTAALPGATVSVGGGDLIGDEANAAVQDDLRNAEIYSLPLTLILLLLIFGGVAAAALPAVAAIATMLGATAVLLGFASVVTIDANAITVVTLLGLASWRIYLAIARRW